MSTDREAPRQSGRLALLDALAATDVPFAERVIAERRVVFINEPALISEVLHRDSAHG